MVEEIIWSPLALETYENIIDHLFQKFGEMAVQRFVQHVDDKIKLIAQDLGCLELQVKDGIPLSPVFAKRQH